MALSSLINGQTIEIDNHNRGTEYKWEKLFICIKE